MVSEGQMKTDRVAQFAERISSAILDCRREESEHYIGEKLTEDNLGDFCMATLVAFHLLISRATGNKGDLLDTISEANRLAFEYLGLSE